MQENIEKLFLVSIKQHVQRNHNCVRKYANRREDRLMYEKVKWL